MNDKPADKPKLTTKQMAFVCAYLQCFNAAKAARQAGYSPDSAKQAGTDNLSKPYLMAEIHRRLDTEGITPERIKIAYADIAFDTDIADFEGWVSSGKTLKELRDEGFNTKLVKSISITAKGCKLEMYSSKDALDSLARVSGMNVDKIQHSGQLDILAVLRQKHGGATDDRLARAARSAGIDDAGPTDSPVGDS